MLVVAPTIKKTDVISALAAALPSIVSGRPHSLQIPELPDLQSLVLIDNRTGRISPTASFGDALATIQGAVDYRDLLIWDRSARDEVSLAGKALDPQDVVNLQFSVSSCLPSLPQLADKPLGGSERNNGPAKGSLVDSLQPPQQWVSHRRMYAPDTFRRPLQCSAALSLLWCVAPG